ncbi:putative major facilitator superfamily transporter [Talaromyces proteolyticus]|uniref:Major facilitator superfamily transporter n=1 Tax=Talaromyces proteolyticus TaxID=1131652 RepID=A0AAD4L6J3_9EURO|nr:putative major facilitator superfamily transporter [Talaromyces proteolyticus]KAH8706051.1 putative major facilitator superfamily transporter [Talaromyces proteolyticus]
MMDNQLETTKKLNGSKCNRNNDIEKDKVDANEFEHATSSESVDAVRYLNNSRAFKGDNSDGQISWNVRSRIAACALIAVYVGTQLPLYFIGGTLNFIAADIGGGEKISWLPVAFSLAIAATCPFVGYVEDVVGRREIALGGSILLCVGSAVIGSSRTLGQAIAGAAIGGIGSGVGEITALAGVSEIVPVNRRGIFLAGLTAAIIPFAPYMMYSQYFSTYTTWRWGLWIALIVNGTGGIFLALTYFPKRVSQSRLSKKEILGQVDYIGAFLSIVGLTLSLVALQSGGYTYPWKSSHVLCPLIIGILLIVAFFLWEWKGAKNPMVPREIFAGQGIVGLVFGIAFVSGMNFYAELNFLPLLYTNVFDPTPYAIGTKSLGVAFGTCLGAVLVNALLSIWKDHNRELLLFFCIIMTSFGGALSAVDPDRPALSVVLSTLLGFGVGGVLVPAQTIAITVTPDAFIATTVALAISIRVLGGSIGYSIYYNVFVNKLNEKLPLLIGEFAVEAGLPLASAKQFVVSFLTTPNFMSQVPGVTPAVIQAAEMGSRWAYSESLAYVWYVSVAFGVMSIVACLFLGNVRPYLTHRIAVELN